MSTNTKISPDGEFIYTQQSKVPMGIISAELQGLFGKKLLAEFADIIKYYDIYDNGAPFMHVETTEGVTDVRSRRSAILIDKQARFMFSVPPDVTVEIEEDDKEEASKIQSTYQSLVEKVEKETRLNQKLLRAAKDCFIGKRVAYTVNFDDETGKITISFVPSLGFVYETDENDTDTLRKLIVFYGVNDVLEKTDQRYYKKKYEMVNGKCIITEGTYNGLGEVIEESDEIKTDFEYIPGGVILNGGLTGDMTGESDIKNIAELESSYNKMSSKDLDAENKNMNPITYTIDMDSNSTKNLPITAGSFWDLDSNQNSDGKTGQIGTIEPKMEYSTALDTTLERVKANMFEMLDIPDTTSKGLQGVVSSGKTLKAIYWGLMVRCDEKFAEWKNALEHIAKTIIDGCKMYEKARKRYSGEKLPDVEYSILVENNYPIQDDINEEKEMDLQEVHNKVRSKKSYMKKYLGLSDDEVEEELQQMARERQIEENAYGFIPSGDQTTRTPTFKDMLNQNEAQQ